MAFNPLTSPESHLLYRDRNTEVIITVEQEVSEPELEEKNPPYATEEAILNYFDIPINLDDAMGTIEPLTVTLPNDELLPADAGELSPLLKEAYELELTLQGRIL